MQNKGGSRQRAGRRFACAPCPIESVVKRCWVSSDPVERGRALIPSGLYKLLGFAEHYSGN
jgi:hypothetical protein